PRLRDFTLSVACENRHEWHPNFLPQIDQTSTELVFRYIHGENKSNVARAVANTDAVWKLGIDVAADAWGQAWQTYWSETATSRFSGLSTISSMMSTIARRIAKREIATRSRNVSDEKTLVEIGANLNVERELLDRSAGAHLRNCIDQLPPKMRVY